MTHDLLHMDESAGNAADLKYRQQVPTPASDLEGLAASWLPSSCEAAGQSVATTTPLLPVTLLPSASCTDALPPLDEDATAVALAPVGRSQALSGQIVEAHWPQV